MNKTRAKQLSDLAEKLQENCTGAIQDFSNELEILKDEEQDYYDNMPESFQQGEKGTKAEENVSSMEDAISALSDAITELERAIDSINEAVENN